MKADMKRGHVIVDIILILIAFVLLVALLTQIFGRVDEETSVPLCRTINAGNVGFLPTVLRATSGGLEACQARDKEDIPTGKYANYPTAKDGAKAQIADMIATCWYEWLEGLPDEDVTAKLLNENVCFPCYSFKIKKGAEMDWPELQAYLQQAPKRVTDTSDQCASTTTGGGKCMDTCGDSQPDAPYQTKEARSKQCPGKKCCVPESRYDECVAKGGEGFTSTEPLIIFSPNDRSARHTWLCPDNQNCYVPQANFVSYYDYVQKGGLGLGFIGAHESVRINPFTAGPEYVIAFNEEVGMFKNVFGDVSQLDSIIIAKFEDIKTKCDIQVGTGKR